MLHCYEVFTDELGSPTHVVWAINEELAMAWAKATLEPGCALRVQQSDQPYPIFSAGVVRRIAVVAGDGKATRALRRHARRPAAPLPTNHQPGYRNFRPPVKVVS